jgi:predicted CXXCH cytochrome family protein
MNPSYDREPVLRKNEFRRSLMRKILMLALAVLSVSLAVGSEAEEIDCSQCHPGLSEGKSVHAAVMMGCPTCHTGVDATAIPHKMSGAAKGLSAEGAELCFGCHDKTKFYGPTIHAPVGVGMCASCHNPHRADNEKLLVAGLQDLCFNCHDKSAFFKKSVHGPVKSGMCVDCHSPHVSSNEFLLVRKGNLLCSKCHPKILREPHAVAGFQRSGHPLSGRKDPNRQGKTFECLSCHLPHTSESPSLFRYKADSMFELCIYCHQM